MYQVRSVFASYLRNHVVCAFMAECEYQLASDHLSYGLMKGVRNATLKHAVSHFRASLQSPAGNQILHDDVESESLLSLVLDAERPV